MTLAEVDALIAKNAARPARAANAMGSVEQQDLSKLLALREEIAEQEAAAAAPAGGRSFRITRLIPPGAQ